jgi:hypothetical protein
MQQVNYWILSMAGGVFVLYFGYLYAMASTEFIVSIPSVWLMGELLMPRKAKE